MSVVPTDAVSIDNIERLMSAQSASLRPLDPVAIAAGIKSERERRAQMLVATQKANDANVRAQIKALSSDDAATQQVAVAYADTLLTAWHDGAVQGVRDFHSSLVPDRTHMGLALSGNLLWAASAIKDIPNPYVVAMSFVGATVGTLGALPPRYDAIIGPVTADVVTRLNNLHDDLLNRLDLLVFPLVKTRGFPTFKAMDHTEQLRFLWTGLFKVPATDGHYIESIRAWVLAGLKAADVAAAARLARLRRAWNASIVVDHLDLEGPHFRLDAKRWKALTSDPIWLFAGRDVYYEVYTSAPADDPPDTDMQARAAVFLRLAIDAQFPSVP